MRILVADDDALFHKLADAVLKRDGYELIHAKDGLQALELFRDQQPDLLQPGFEQRTAPHPRGVLPGTEGPQGVVCQSFPHLCAHGPPSQVKIRRCTPAPPKLSRARPRLP